MICTLFPSIAEVVLSTTGWIDWLLKIGIVAIVLATIWALLRYFGVTIHPVVRIIVGGIAAIIGLILLVKLLMLLL